MVSMAYVVKGNICMANHARGGKKRIRLMCIRICNCCVESEWAAGLGASPTPDINNNRNMAEDWTGRYLVIYIYVVFVAR